MRQHFALKYIYAKVLIVLFGIAYRGIQGQAGCGFPGSPVHGMVTPKKENYKLNDTVKFSCIQNYELDGPNSKNCIEDNKWHHTPVPLCLKELARGQNAFQSTIANNQYKANFAIDGNVQTCSQTVDGDRDRFWEVTLKDQYNITKVIIDASVMSAVPFNITVKIGNHRRDFKAKECFSYYTAGVAGGNNPHISQYCTETIKGQIVTIEDRRSNPKWRLRLCEVKVLAAPDIQKCGDPDNTQFCNYDKVGTSITQQVKYYGKPGYTLDEPVLRTCVDGKWSGNAPKCKPSVSAITSSRYGTASSTMSTTSPEKTDQQNKNNSFVMGIAIGVTTASVSTIIVVITLIIVLRKYYKRTVPPSVVVTSETDSVFLRANIPSSNDSGSPRIHQTFSDPWDDPRYHVYDYICPDTITVDKPSAEETSLISLPLVDAAGYLTSRSEKISDTHSASEKLLQPVGQQDQQLSSSTLSTCHSPPARVCSYNELEVDAYGYQDTSYV